MKKKILAITLCVAMLAVMLVSGTLAYFTDEAAKTNTIVVGNVSAELYESQYHRGATGNSYLKMTDQPEPLTDDDIVEDYKTYHTDYLAKAKLMPFNASATNNQVQSMWEECTVAKNVYIENTSETNDCFVRVRYIVPAEIAEYLDIWYVGTQFIAKTDAIATADARTLDNDDDYEPMITDVITSGANFTKQTTHKDAEGNYYAEFIYAERLTPDEFTLYSPISKITLIPSVTEEIIGALNLTNRQFEIEVEADIIQADGFLNALDAFAAFDAQNEPQA